MCISGRRRLSLSCVSLRELPARNDARHCESGGKTRDYQAMLKRISPLIFAAALGWGVALLSSWHSGPTPQVEASPIVIQEERATVLAVKSVSPAVVSILMKQKMTLGGGTVYRIIPGTGVEAVPTEPKTVEQEVSRGTGFLVRRDGVILTNRHVVDFPGATVTVLLSDGTSRAGRVLAKDPLNDLAVVKIDGGQYPIVRLGDSDQIEEGQTVIALGNSLGRYANTVTKGVVSGLGRNITANDANGQPETLADIIQTDAAINPGNSGGPLVTLQGEVIGMNTAVDLQGQSIGFAIPINAAKPAITSVLTRGKISRPRLGIRYIMITPELREARSLPVDEGAYLVAGDPDEPAVVPGSPAAIAGLQAGDIITLINGKKITRDRSLQAVVARLRVGDKAEITVLRDAKTLSIRAVLDETPD